MATKGVPPKERKAGTVLVTEGVHTAIVTALKSHKLKPIWDSNPVMCGVNVTKWYVEVVQFDAQHILYRKARVKSLKEFSFSLPLSMMVGIIKAWKGGKYSISIDEDAVRACNDEFEYEGPHPEISKANSLENAIDLVNSLRAGDSFAVQEGKVLHKVLDCGLAMYEPKTIMRIAVHSGTSKVDFTVSSGSGSMISTLPTYPGESKGLEFSTDMRLLKDILPILKVRKGIRFNLHNNRVLWFGRKQSDGTSEVRCTSVAM